MPYNSANDQFPGGIRNATTQARMASAITPSDTNDLNPYPKSIYVGVSGDLSVIPLDAPSDTPVLLKSHPIGYLRLQVRRVMSTNTTASSLVSLSG